MAPTYNTLELIIENYPDESFLKADGFDDAVIGFEDRSMRLIYSTIECIRILQADGMTYEDAIDYFYYNVEGSFVGELTLRIQQTPQQLTPPTSLDQELMNNKNQLSLKITTMMVDSAAVLNTVHGQHVLMDTK